MLTTTQLKGKAFGALSDSIGDAFSKSDIVKLLRVKMDIDLDRLIGSEGGTDDLFFNLMSELEKKGIILDFLRHVLIARPALEAVITEHCPEALETAPDPKDAADTAAGGISVLKQHLNDPQVRILIKQHKDELEKLISDLEALANYKRLHDILQTIQINYFADLASGVQRLGTDDTAAMTIETHAVQLDELCRNALTAARALPNVAATRLSELAWVGKLTTVIEQIQRSVETLDRQEGIGAMLALRALLRKHPSRINDLIMITAEGLSLERLVSTVEDVVRRTAGADAESGQLRDGFRSLQGMLPQLKGPIAEHNQWQEIERDFWLIDDYIQQATEDSIQNFHEAWPFTRDKVAALAGNEPNASWARKSQTHAATIDANLTTQPAKAQLTFGLFRHTVMFHFFQVDRALRYQCEATLVIKDPLKSLLRAV